jgi:hypothetical protein
VQEVLIDRGELVLELGLQMVDDLRVALHDLFLVIETVDCGFLLEAQAREPML